MRDHARVCGAPAVASSPPAPADGAGEARDAAGASQEETIGRTRLMRSLLPLIAVAVLIAACGGDDDEAASFSLVTEGTLTVCTDAPYEPFEFEAADGTFTGFDMDLLREIAGGLDLELSVAVVPFDSIWLLPAAGECDLVGSAMRITEERQQAALFSDPYFDADQSLLVRAADSGQFATLASLAGANIGVQTGTTGEIYAQENAPPTATLLSFDEPPSMFLALESGDIDAILQDLPVNGFRQTQDDSMVVTEAFPTGEQYGFAVDPDNAGLIEAVNEELARLRSSGAYDEIFEKWFG